MSKYSVAIKYTWAQFTEEFQCILNAESVKELQDKIDTVIIKDVNYEITRHYSFDCGDTDKPLNPRIIAIEATPIDEKIYFGISDRWYNEVLKDEVEFYKSEIEKGNQFINGQYNKNMKHSKLEYNERGELVPTKG